MDIENNGIRSYLGNMESIYNYDVIIAIRYVIEA